MSVGPKGANRLTASSLCCGVTGWGPEAGKVATTLFCLLWPVVGLGRYLKAAAPGASDGRLEASQAGDSEVAVESAQIVAGGEQGPFAAGVIQAAE